jgi:hypothetical protein
MEKDINATFDTADAPCESCSNLQRTHADAAAEYLGLLRKHQSAADPDAGLLEELGAAVKRELARGALQTHLATGHNTATQ